MSDKISDEMQEFKAYKATKVRLAEAEAKGQNFLEEIENLPMTEKKRKAKEFATNMRMKAALMEDQFEAGQMRSMAGRLLRAIRGSEVSSYQV
jgi:uncharacterized secreted protein with C-terminal beta-propeller domain|tara:strand:+ start:139 stop:417 length:279 start_codon:yes stop_codon:yes gene_type:complete